MPQSKWLADANQHAGPACLRVHARGYALVPDYEAQKNGSRRFHGWKHDPTLGPSFVDQADKQKKNHGGFVRQTGLAVEIPIGSEFLTEYVRHLRDGDLWAADAATAAYVGRPFEPAFDGEHPSPISPVKLAAALSLPPEPPTTPALPAAKKGDKQ